MGSNLLILPLHLLLIKIFWFRKLILISKRLDLGQKDRREFDFYLRGLEKAMAKFKPYDYSQGMMIPESLDNRLVPGRGEFAIPHLSVCILPQSRGK